MKRKLHLCKEGNWATANDARVLRHSSGLTQIEVAKAMGISQPYLSDLEYGRRNWRRELVNNFNRALGIR